MATLQKPYNLFATPPLTRPVQAFDRSKSVDANMAGDGSPSGRDITSALQTPTARAQSVPASQPQDAPSQAKAPVIDAESATSGLDYLAGLNYTSPADEERLRKASVANQRILAVGDALRQIGNIYHTTRYAPSQKFNSPVIEEQARYEKGKALRDAANARYVSYQQAKAAQDAKNRQWAATFNYNAAKDAAAAAALKDYRDRGLEAKNRQFYDGLAYRSYNDEKNRQEKGRHNKVMEKQGQQRIGIAASNAKNAQDYRQWRMNGGGGSGRTPIPYDTAIGPLYANGSKSMDEKQMKQLYFKAKELGLVPKYADMLSSVDYSKALDYLRTNEQLARYAKDTFGWTSTGGGVSHYDDPFGDDEEDEMHYDDPFAE